MTAKDVIHTADSHVFGVLDAVAAEAMYDRIQEAISAEVEDLQPGFLIRPIIVLFGGLQIIPLAFGYHNPSLLYFYCADATVIAHVSTFQMIIRHVRAPRQKPKREPIGFRGSVATSSSQAQERGA